MDSANKPDSQGIRDQLQRILGSPDFDTSERSRDFLRFVVEATLKGRETDVTQHAIATSVFGRRDNFDPTTDPIVRMQAGRVRRSLEHYYLSGGRDDPLIIEIPKGSYVPVFHHRDSPGSQPTLLVSPFANLTQDSGLDFLAQGLASDLAIELDRYGHVQVFLGEATEGREPQGAPLARFAIEGSLGTLNDALKISFRLIDVGTRQQLWGQQYRHEAADPKLPVFLDELAQTIAATLADERGFLPRRLSRDIPARQSKDFATYEAILRFYHFDRAPSLEGFHQALEGLRHAVELEPEYGLAWAHLARLYATNYGLEFADEETPIETALSYAETGVRLEPLDQRTRITKAFVHLLRGDVGEGRLEVEEAIALNPYSLFFLDGVGYLLTLLGDWGRGVSLSKKAVRLNPCHRDVVHAGLWLDAVRREDYQTALHEAEAYLQTGHFWQPLMRAVPLAYLDRLDDAAPLVEQILLLKPGFRERGRWLIERYVKFDELIERIERGLAKLGLDII